jgi:hypothetical protein
LRQFIAFASLHVASRQRHVDNAKAGGVVVFRGFLNNSMKAFSAMLGKVVTDKDHCPMSASIPGSFARSTSRLS